MTMNSLTFFHPVLDHHNEVVAVLAACFPQREVHVSACRLKLRVLAEGHTNLMQLLKCMNSKFTELMNSSISCSTKNNVLNLMNNSLSMFMDTIDQINSVSRDHVLKISEDKIGELLKCETII